MAKTPVEFLPAAVADLDEIFDYILATDATAAENMLATIMDALKRLEIFPSSGIVLQERSLISYQYRMMIIPPYIAFYRCLEGRVLIYRILHGARDYSLILKGFIQT